MPPLNKGLMTTLAKTFFFAKGIKLPVDWPDPPDPDHYPVGFELYERMVAPNPPMTLFTQESLNKYHVDAAREIGKLFEDYITAICGAICNGVELWRLQAKFGDLKIMAVSAIGAPGCLSGPKLADQITAVAGPQDTEMKKKYTDAIAAGVHKCWDEWCSKVMVPGLPWYPAFAAFPGPMAPPMPNVPMPLISCPSAGLAKMMPGSLKDAMMNKLGSAKDHQHSEELCDAIAKALSIVFMIWLPSQQIMLVMGKGPVPSFAPPYVPVGPVVGGDNIAVPGHLMS